MAKWKCLQQMNKLGEHFQLDIYKCSYKQYCVLVHSLLEHWLWRDLHTQLFLRYWISFWCCSRVWFTYCLNQLFWINNFWVESETSLIFCFVDSFTFSWSFENVITFESPIVGAAVVRNASLMLSDAFVQKVTPRKPKCDIPQTRRMMDPKPRAIWA